MLKFQTGFSLSGCAYDALWLKYIGVSSLTYPYPLWKSSRVSRTVDFALITAMISLLFSLLLNYSSCASLRDDYLPLRTVIMDLSLFDAFRTKQRKLLTAIFFRIHEPMTMSFRYIYISSANWLMVLQECFQKADLIGLISSTRTSLPLATMYRRRRFRDAKFRFVNA